MGKSSEPGLGAFVVLAALFVAVVVAALAASDVQEAVAPVPAPPPAEPLQRLLPLSECRRHLARGGQSCFSYPRLQGFQGFPASTSTLLTVTRD